MKKRLIIFFILFSAIAFGQNQELSAKKIGFVALDCDQFLKYDQFGFYYYIKNNILLKTKEKESFEYKNISLGEITKVDLLNPLTIILFYENFNTAVLLDNQLNETQKINFSENDEPLIVTAVGIASQNRVWIYNSLTQKIGLFDYLKNTYQPISTSIQGDLKWYHSDFNTFQWIDESLNWYSCDLFGKITLIGKVSDFDQIQITEDNAIVFSKDKKLYLNDFKKDILYTIDIVEKSFGYFYYKDQILSIFTPQLITNFKISKL